jgi:hypothetical protein
MKGEAKVMLKDNKGQTPLHLAVQKAEFLKPEGEARNPFRQVIERLMNNTLDIDEPDYDGNTPLHYAKGLTWITEIKENRQLYTGATTSAKTERLKKPDTPREGTPQRKACQKFPGVLAEFYLKSEKKATKEKLNVEKPSIFDMIYKEQDGPKRILDRSRPKLKDEIFQCRWLHLPANNVSYNFATQANPF